MEILNRPVLPTITLLLLTLTACGGGNSGSSTGSNNPVVAVIGNDVDSDGDGTPDIEDNCPQAANSDQADTNDNGLGDVCEGALQSVTTSASITDTVQSDRYNVYNVPSGSQVVLNTNSGNIGLYLYTSLDFDDDNLVCAAVSAFKENTCTATVDDGELYALVYGRVPSSYMLSATNDCSDASVNNWVNRSMLDYYLYYDQVPSVVPENYSSTQNLLNDLRLESLDPYTNVRDAVSQSQFSEQGILKGLGYRWGRDNNDVARIASVYDNSPFGRAGIKRGDIIVSINGELWDEMTSERFTQLTGTSDNPLAATWRFVDGETDAQKDAVITLGEFTANTVLHSQQIVHPQYSGSIGYIAFSSFIETSSAELDNVFSGFKASGVNDLILDLRYNGGGRTSIARQMASQIAGPATDGELLIEYQYNNKYSGENFSRNFEPQPHNLGLTRLLVLTSGNTASSSEIVINSLKPYIEVITLGSKTKGKPYISTSNTFCGKTLNAMEAQGVNASGVGVAGGIPADCFAEDDLTRDFGVKSGGQIEGMAGAAADYLVFGTCQASTFASSSDNRRAQIAGMGTGISGNFADGEGY